MSEIVLLKSMFNYSWLIWNHCTGSLNWSGVSYFENVVHHFHCIYNSLKQYAPVLLEFCPDFLLLWDYFLTNWHLCGETVLYIFFLILFPWTRVDEFWKLSACHGCAVLVWRFSMKLESIVNNVCQSWLGKKVQFMLTMNLHNTAKRFIRTSVCSGLANMHNNSQTTMK